VEHKDQIPLKWPEGWSRTLIDQRQSRSAWKKPFSFYREQVLKELERIGASAVTISRNEPAKERVDPGVAVWFSLKPAEDFSWQTGLHLDNPMPSLEEIDECLPHLGGSTTPTRWRTARAATSPCSTG
jgi:hypothetical protein